MHDEEGITLLCAEFQSFARSRPSVTRQGNLPHVSKGALKAKETALPIMELTSKNDHSLTASLSGREV
jgi:hypothetical protein